MRDEKERNSMEASQYLNELSEEWIGITSIIPYGFGLEASIVIDKLIKDFEIPFLIDNDPKKAHTTYHGIEIIPWSEAAEQVRNRKIVITTRNRAYVKIAKTLEDAGLHDGKDYTVIKRFIPEWYWKNRHECCAFTVDTAVSTNCTFKCKNCNMFMPCYKRYYMHRFEDFKRNFDLYFQVVDYVGYIGLLGGEPLLCNCLEEVIEYLFTTYRDRFGTCKLHTNGSVAPSESLLKLMKEHNMTVAVSDYGDVAPCREQVRETVAAFKSNGIHYDDRTDLEWRDMGAPHAPNAFAGEALKHHMEMCSADWPGLEDGKYYYCNIAWSAEKAGLTELEEGDFLNLAELAKLGEEGKCQLLLHTAGYFPKGYMSFCKICGGCGVDNEKIVRAGVQV